MKIIVATRNPGKLREIRLGLEGLAVELLSLADFPAAPEVEEDGDSFAANAVKKARALCADTGIPALADDSGLEVDALQGAPGIRSARFAGEGATDAENNAKLLSLLHGVRPEKRTARFRCVIALAWPDGRVDTVEGIVEGRILEVPRGDQGFGYDPLFYSSELNASFAEVVTEVKLRASHRGKALARIRQILQFDVKRPEGSGT
ncbi:MAG: non-canonical purine NTP pyrophosphatase, RdgB/HAM1 family [Deltaproteobacteria bacterium RBG_13_61_14]|nr:MAG: non-canonical purine NTP pyrophosphatase, RdgB/HAM1 family [Deltaproteobacteria bacterium RBG_13_61_14]